jgi:quercetin dioxygenase-like cupin family protein
MNTILPSLLLLAAVAAAQGGEPAIEVTDAAALPVESAAWGTLQWVCNAKLMPGAQQTVGLATILPGKSNPIHFHPNCEEILHVLSGQGIHSIDGRTVALKAGMTIRVPAGAKHNLVNTGTEPLKTVVSFSSGDRKTVFLEQAKAK